MQERSRNFAVGLTAMAGLAVFAVLLILFGAAPQLFRSGYEIRVYLDQAGGLRAASRVTYNGIDVGDVQSVALAPAPRHGVVVVAHIDEGVSLPTDVNATVSGPLFGGSPALALSWTPKDGEEPEAYLPTDGTAAIDGSAASLAEGLANRLSAELREPLRELQRVSASFEVLSAEWTRVGQNINQLVEPRTPETVDGGDAMGNLASMIARADARMAELREVLGRMNNTLEGAQRWVENEELRDNVQATVANARELTANLNAKIDVLSKRYVAVADDLSAAIRTLNQTAELARSGEGTVGKLLNDPSLYNNLNDAAARLKLAMDELNLLLEQFREEGLPLQFE